MPGSPQRPQPRRQQLVWSLSSSQGSVLPRSGKETWLVHPQARGATLGFLPGGVGGQWSSSGLSLQYHTKGENQPHSEMAVKQTKACSNTAVV